MTTSHGWKRIWSRTLPTGDVYILSHRIEKKKWDRYQGIIISRFDNTAHISCPSTRHKKTVESYYEIAKMVHAETVCGKNPYYDPNVYSKTSK